MATRTLLAASHASLTPPPPVSTTPEPQGTEEVLDGGVAGFQPTRLRGRPDARDHATGSDEWTPAETAISTIPVGGRVHNITVSPDGEHVYVARSHSVIGINGRQHTAGSIPVTGPAKSLVMDAGGQQLFVMGYDGSVLVIDTREHVAQTLRDECAWNVV